MTLIKAVVIRTFCVILLVILGNGCTGVKVRFANAPVERLDLTRGRTITGSAAGLQLFCILPFGVNDRHVEAYERLLMQAGTDYVTDIKIREARKFAFFGTVYRTTLTATAYPDIKDAPVPARIQSLSQKLEELKGLRDKGLLTDAEYEAARKKALGL